MPGAPENFHPLALTATPIEQVACEVAGYIRQIRPQVIITFDPIGGYRHPDHIAIHRATVDAFRIAGDAAYDMEDLAPYSPQKLYFSTFPRTWLRAAVRLVRMLGRDPRHLGANRDIDLESLIEIEFPIHAVISIRDVMRQKEEAAACHASQGGNFGAAGRWLQRILASSESYMRAVPADPPPRIERDLFEGVEE
jgi:LmbE family N-acetylglucosaminyl deacetylase